MTTSSIALTILYASMPHAINTAYERSTQVTAYSVSKLFASSRQVMC